MTRPTPADRPAAPLHIQLTVNHWLLALNPPSWPPPGQPAEPARPTTDTPAANPKS